MLITVIGHLLAICIGISLGLIGGGGSILAAPVLIYVMSVPAKSAFAMTLVIVGVASLIGAIPHWRQGNVNPKIIALFAPASMLGAYLGARLASLPFITPTIQLVTFGVMMLIASITMIRKGASKSENPLDKAGHSDRHTVIPKWLAIALEGLAVGTLTGFIGIGGGFLVIPALVLLGKTPMKEAVGTSLIILALKSVTGFAGYFGHVPIDWTLLLSFTIASSAGILLGSYLNQFVSAKQLEKGFGYFVLAVAVFVLIKR
ncbi:sulfite exporter TauE/SafE family protein [Thermoleptolyngbya sichuanensis A183]|uniref:Probable membrane transporter protein n=1 Tax=Thermoleptolyngbya sichuanensis A183 TaxID=2737172 RepID=A0A6M8BCZ3_9CYAN|nr:MULTISPECIES: sulfite exporter TauE/SafE family protein [Thermoleptolyngbya]QKD82727.1 sulfite exporter TauE/SafE family protein [Thermoleptolyngbya sichuanensis A183]